MAGAEAGYTQAFDALRKRFSPGVWHVQIQVLVTMGEFPRAVVQQAILDTSFGKTYWQQLDALPPSQEPRWRWYYMPLAPATMPFAISQITNLGSWLLYQIKLNWQHLLKLNTWMLNTGARIFEEFFECGHEIADAMGLMDSNPLRRRLLNHIQADRNLYLQMRDQSRYMQGEYRHFSAPRLSRRAQKRQWQAWGWRIHG
jgi:hypothetical protein